MTDEYDANQMLAYEEEVNALDPAADRAGTVAGDGWQRQDDRYGNCAAVWCHESGDEILVYPDDDGYEVLRKSAESGALRRVRPFPTPDEAEAFVEGMLTNLAE